MKKISTLFKKDPKDLGRVINEVDPKNYWVIEGYSIPTRKFDGSSSAIIDGDIYKRYDAKRGKTPPKGAIPCVLERDPNTGHFPHWVKCDRSNNADKYFFEAFDVLDKKEDNTTYELVGEKVQGNPEKVKGHKLIKHGDEELPIKEYTFEYLKQYLSNPDNDIEGIVFHHKKDDRMCKLRKSDFGIKR